LDYRRRSDASVATGQLAPFLRHDLEGLTEGLLAVSDDGALADLRHPRFQRTDLIAKRTLLPGDVASICLPHRPRNRSNLTISVDKRVKGHKRDTIVSI